MKTRDSYKWLQIKISACNRGSIGGLREVQVSSIVN